MILFEQDQNSGIEIYVDEIEPHKGFNYIAIGALFLETHYKNRLCNELLNIRCRNPKNKTWAINPKSCQFYERNCRLKKYHKNSDKEIHYNELKRNSTKNYVDICTEWLKKWNNSKGMYLNLLLIDMEKIDPDYFGNKLRANIYNRFLRTVISYGMKSFFGNKPKLIKNIFYDKSESLEQHDYFPSRNISKMKNDLKLSFENENIVFVDSDHKKSELYYDSNIIQFVDSTIGAIKQNIFKVSDDENNNKSNVSYTLNSLLRKIEKDRNSVKKIKMSIFPEKPLNELENYTNFNEEDVLLNGKFRYLQDIGLKLNKEPKPLTLDKFF